jgi:hypothetical protein
MTLYEFNSLTLEEKQATVWDKGTFLDNHITEDIRLNYTCILWGNFWYLQKFLKPIYKYLYIQVTRYVMPFLKSVATRL